MLEALLENAETAETGNIPLCQDTGLPQVLIEAGRETAFTGRPLQEAVERGVREAFRESFLRRSGADPLTRRNLGDEIPVSLELTETEGSSVRVYTLAKGGGCDNKSALFNLPPTSSPEAVRKAVLERLASAGPDSCPPWYIGICLGGTFESAPRHARRALWDLAFGENPDPREEGLSAEYLSAANALGLGPLALGGRTTALGLRIRILPAHIASLPVAINLCCHSFRPGKGVI